MSLLDILPWRIMREVIEAGRPCAREVIPATEPACEVTAAPRRPDRGHCEPDPVLDLVRHGW